MELDRKLKMGMVGGGRDAFIGAVHRSAALMDGKIEFIAGALSSDPEKAKASAQDLLISEDRSYETWQEKGTTIESLCRQKARDILANHQPVALPAEVEAEIERILRRYLGPEFSLNGSKKKNSSAQFRKD